MPAWATQAAGDLRDEDRLDADVRCPMAESRAKSEVEKRPAELGSIPGLPSLFTSSLSWQPPDSPSTNGESSIDLRRDSYRCPGGGGPSSFSEVPPEGR